MTTTAKPSLVEQKLCIDCGKPTLGSLDALGEQPICFRPCWMLRQVGAITAIEAGATAPRSPSVQR